MVWYRLDPFSLLRKVTSKIIPRWHCNAVTWTDLSLSVSLSFPFCLPPSLSPSVSGLQKCLLWWLEWWGWATSLALRGTGTRSLTFTRSWGQFVQYLQPEWWQHRNNWFGLNLCCCLLVSFDESKFKCNLSFPLPTTHQCGTPVSFWLGLAHRAKGSDARNAGICMLPCWRWRGEGPVVLTCCPITTGEPSAACCLTWTLPMTPSNLLHQWHDPPNMKKTHTKNNAYTTNGLKEKGRG